MKRLKKTIIIILAVLVFLTAMYFFLARKEIPENIVYGMSFNTMYAEELGLDWRETYDAIVDDLGVRNFRLAAHWPMVEPTRGTYNFEELDYQINKAETVGAEIILAVGRRLPRWPECHVPSWFGELTVAEGQEAQLAYMKAVVERYRNSPAIKYWQVENEPFLEVFAFEHCGELDTDFLDKEISFVKELDPTRSIIVTDSGNLGLWYGAYKRGDIFGSSVYVHFWNPELGQFRTVLPPSIYRVKEKLLSFVYGKKPTFLIELSAEPWLIAPIATVPIETQFSRMDLAKFEDILEYAKQTRYERQYLWGAEWWYWLLKQDHPEMWNKGKTIFNHN